MQGLLADVNVQGCVPILVRLFETLDLAGVLTALELRMVTFPDLRLRPDLDDRSLWNFCQAGGWVLFTENRNEEGRDSLQATLADSWTIGQLPILTLANKNRFHNDRPYQEKVATDLAELLFGLAQGEYHDQPRIYIPL